MNSPTHSLSHIHRAPWESADLRDALAGGGGGWRGDLDRVGLVVAPMGTALSLSGNHFVRHTTLIRLVSLLPSVLSRPGLRLEGVGVEVEVGAVEEPLQGYVWSGLLFEDRPHCTILRHLMQASWELNELILKTQEEKKEKWRVLK